jgi:diguanylate cyclase (GGDEF)-like protein
MLSMIGETIQLMAHRDTAHTTLLLQQSVAQSRGFNSLVLLDANKHILAHANRNTPYSAEQAALFAGEKCVDVVMQKHDWAVSKMKRHPVTNEPTMFMGTPMYDENKQLVGVLIGELRIDVIEDIRRRVKFGKLGHSAIVDHTGHVIAHPNPKWMAEIKDLSDWAIVKDMIAGKTGVTTFYSPFMKGDMVAGYAAVPNTGWGIMVPQPESEVAAHVHSLMLSHLTWALVGLVLAILFAIIISRWVTGPLNRLANAGKQLMLDGLQGHFLTNKRPQGPAEVRQLCTVLRALITGLQSSRDQVKELNGNLQRRVDEATLQLREANSRLEDAAQHDFLTELANRRYFEDCLQQTLSRRSSDIDHVCVMLIDIDHFKQINDAYGHAAGDAVLTQVARILERGMRSGDLVARYGGDEFVAFMRCTPAIGNARAKELRDAIDTCAIHHNGKSIHITASIGLHCQRLQPGVDLNKVMSAADHAMYTAKQQGRNRVVGNGH